MFSAFVLVTGVLDLLLGLVVAFPALRNPGPNNYLNPIMIGAFLVFCGAALMWSSQNVRDRGPIIFWQGLVRVAAVIAILVGVNFGWVEQKNLAAAVMDGIIGPTYLIGVCRVLRRSPLEVVLGKSVH